MRLMTAKEALYWCEQFENNVLLADPEQRKMFLALRAMRRCKDALAKQIPRKPFPSYIGIETDATALTCPACRYQDECDFEDAHDRKYNYCPMCGQALERKEQE